jgi:hypothetical protein
VYYGGWKMDEERGEHESRLIVTHSSDQRRLVQIRVPEWVGWRKAGMGSRKRERVAQPWAAGYDEHRLKSDLIGMWGQP